jgi:predicted enzyme related to lactoylglutathione lyase
VGARATGIGGVVFRPIDPEALYRWSERHLGLKRETDSAVILPYAADPTGSAVLAIFPSDTTYFGRSGQASMINLRVRDLDALLSRLRADGVEVGPDIEALPFGRFAWIVDADGNRVELGEPTAGA